MRTRPLALLFLLGSMLGAAPARADDKPEKPEDPAALLRRARTAEGVDRDVPRAMELYKAVVAAGGTSDAAREAAMRLADLEEVRGERGAAVETLKVITERFGDRLDEDAKRHVHEALARLLPAGSHARSPLGDVYVLPSPGAASNPSGSPLEAKILAILSRLDDAQPDQRSSVEYAVNSALEPVGLEALPVLERVMNGERPERARFAAQAYARLGKAAAIPGLVKTVREGDGFARASAIGGLAVISPEKGVSVPFVAAVTPLLELAQVQDRRQLLREALAPHLTDEDLLAREARGGPDAPYWLSTGVKRKLPAAVRRVEEITKQGGPLPEGLVNVLEEMAGSVIQGWGNEGPTLSAKDPELAGALRLAMLEAVAAQSPTPGTVDACASIAGAITLLGPVDAATRAAEVAWTHALGLSDTALRGQAMSRLVQSGVRPSVRALSDPDRMGRYLAGLSSRSTRLGTGSVQYELVWLLGKPVQSLPGFWEGIARILKGFAGVPDTQVSFANAVGKGLGEKGVALPPPEHDGLWLDLLAGLPEQAQQWRLRDYAPWLPRAAARSGKPAFLALVRRELARPDGTGGSWLAVVAAVYPGPGRIELAVDLLLGKSDLPRGMGDLVLALRDDPAFWRALLPKLETAPEGIVARAFQWLGYQVNPMSSRPPSSPAEVDALWLPIVRRKDLTGFPSFVLTALERLGTPETVALARDVALDPEWDPTLAQKLLFGLSKSRAPGRGAMLAELLLDPRSARVLLLDANVAIAALEVVEAEPDGMAAVRRIAKTPLAPGSALAVRRLAARDDRATLAEILAERTSPTAPSSSLGRDYELIQAARALHMKEGVPFLLMQFQGPNYSQVAADAMDSIRAYHERLATFQTYGKGDAGSRQDVVEMLDVEDPDIRRAAVLSYGALLGKDALPRLLKIAKDEGDEGVRKAALETIERIARSAGPAPEPKAPEAPVPAMGEDAGMK